MQRGEKQKKDLGALNFVARINAFGSVVKKMRALFQVPKMLLAVFFVKDLDAAAAGFALKQFLVLKKIYAKRAQVLKTNAWKEF